MPIDPSHMYGGELCEVRVAVNRVRILRAPFSWGKSMLGQSE